MSDYKVDRLGAQVMTEHSEALGLEQRCIEPGHWLIEGIDVRHDGNGWYADRNGQKVWTGRTLAEARSWIADGAEVAS